MVMVWLLVAAVFIGRILPQYGQMESWSFLLSDSNCYYFVCVVVAMGFYMIPQRFVDWQESIKD